MEDKNSKVYKIILCFDCGGGGNSILLLLDEKLSTQQQHLHRHHQPSTNSNLMMRAFIITLRELALLLLSAFRCVLAFLWFFTLKLPGKITMPCLLNTSSLQNVAPREISCMHLPCSIFGISSQEENSMMANFKMQPAECASD